MYKKRISKTEILKNNSLFNNVHTILIKCYILTLYVLLITVFYV